MKMQSLAATGLGLAPLTALAHAGHGLAAGHEWFHALVPFAGTALLLLLLPMLRRVPEICARAMQRRGPARRDATTSRKHT